MPPASRADGGPRQPGRCEPVDRGAAERAEHPLQRRSRPRRRGRWRHTTTGRSTHPSPDVAQHVQGGVVGPVHVLHDQHGGPAAVRRARRAGPRGRRRGRPRAAPSRACRLCSARVAQRAEGARRDEVVARAEQHPHVIVGPDERTHEAGLADPGLTRDAAPPNRSRPRPGAAPTRDSPARCHVREGPDRAAVRRSRHPSPRPDGCRTSRQIVGSVTGVVTRMLAPRSRNVAPHR